MYNSPHVSDSDLSIVILRHFHLFESPRQTVLLVQGFMSELLCLLKSDLNNDDSQRRSRFCPTFSVVR